MISYDQMPVKMMPETRIILDFPENLKYTVANNLLNHNGNNFTHFVGLSVSRASNMLCHGGGAGSPQW